MFDSNCIDQRYKYLLFVLKCMDFFINQINRKKPYIKREY